MTGSLPTANLADIAELNPALAEALGDNDRVSFIPMSAVDVDAASTIEKESRCYSEVSKGYTPFRDGDLLIARITPCFENGKIAQARLTRHVGFGSTEFHVVRPHADRADARYLLRFLRQERIRHEGQRKMTGSAGQRRVPEHFLAGLDVPLPPLPEQRRIAEMLDRAEMLRARRRAALDQLDALAQSIFIDMFGDPATNPKGWPSQPLEQFLTIPLRNGLSPSNEGSVTAKVLTLSAITGANFDSTAWKTSTFKTKPPPAQSVDELDFLICRGNGNLHLVGKGAFPTTKLDDVTFPDTMIAARVLPERIERAFLQFVWNSNAVRRQIESVARTTNGTFKVNQTMLERIRFYTPPRPLQRDFALRVKALGNLKSVHRTALEQLDALFAALQYRAFRGEL